MANLQKGALNDSQSGALWFVVTQTYRDILVKRRSMKHLRSRNIVRPWRWATIS